MFENINILHVIDDQKFIPYCEKTFNLKGIKNEYVTSINFYEFLLCTTFDMIIIHYLNREKARVINNINIKTPIIWFFWGGDGFLLGKFFAFFLKSKTKSLYIKLAFKRSINEGVKVLLKFPLSIISDFLSHNKEIIKAFEKIDLVVPVMPEDYNLLKSKYNITATMFHLNYVNPSFSETSKNLVLKGENILLGNSASYSNNHVEAINLLSKLNLGERKVFIPLSYGDTQYADYIAQYASKVLVNNLLCLRDFIPINDYMKILEKCSIVIMNHKRQQAVGNIVPLLAQGSHIYLNEESSLYIYLKEKGFYVSKINEIVNLRNLNLEEQHVNNKLCSSFFGEKRQHKQVDILLKKIIKSDNDN